ncbi:hypothetical protein Taro_010575 [Colocasia esculenta]|uniref:HhH-GPD domain-containing protein n=1 Tax=Colocasia esculenta TaxID=4460 RepID=A0A843U3P6_COLES|nr:hypothetical protein [Colocasia esculenta]
MDVRRGVLPEEQDLQMPGAWIPSTPGKPLLLERQHAAAAGGQRYYAPGMNWLEPMVGLPRGAACGSGAVQEGASQGGSPVSAGVAGPVLDLNSFGAAAASQGGVFGSVFSPQAPPMRGAMQGWHHVRYSDLVAMASNADAPRSTGIPSPAFLFGDIRSDHQQPSTSLLLNGRMVLNTELLNGVQSLASSCETLAPPFAPVTPDKQKGLDGQHLGSADSVHGGGTGRGGQDQASAPLALHPKAKDQVVQLHSDEGVLEQACLATAGLSIQLQENEAREKAEQEVDLNKTQAQKPRRKKHRPKVVVEGKPARTPKQATPKPATPKPAGAGEGTPGKRKYIRRKGLTTPMETSPNVLGETSKTHVKRARSAKRQLDFSNELEKVTCQGTTNTEQAQGQSMTEKNIEYTPPNSTGHGISSTDVVTEGQRMDVNSSARIALALNHYNNQVLDGFLNSPDSPSYPLQPSRRELIWEKLKHSTPLETSPNVLGGETIKTHVKRARSVKRQPDFSNELEKVTCQGTTNTEQTQGQSMPEKNIGCTPRNSTGHGICSTDVVTEGQRMDVNSSARIALALNHYNNQVLDGFLNSPDTPSYPLQPSRRELIWEKLKHSTPLETSPNVLGGETIKTHVKRARSVKRQPDFSNELEKMTCQGTTNTEQAQGQSMPEKDIGYTPRNSTGHGISSTDVVTEGQRMDVNSSARIALALNHYNNQVLDGFLNSPDSPSYPLQPSRRELIWETLKHSTPLETSPNVLGGETIKTHVKRARSVKRQPDFSNELEKVTCQGTTNTEQTQGQSMPEKNIGCTPRNCTGHGICSTDVVTEGQRMDVNSSARIALALNHYNNQVLDGFLNSPDTPSYPLQPSRRKLIWEKLKHSTPLDTSPNVLGGETTKTHVKRARSVTRQLDLSNELEKVTCQGTTNTEQAQGQSMPEKNIGYTPQNNTGHGISSTNVVPEGQRMVANSSARIALALNHSNNQVLDGFLNSLDIPSLPLQPSRRELIRENLKKLARIRDSRQVTNHGSPKQCEVQASCQSVLENASTSFSASNMLSRGDNTGRNEGNTGSNLLNDDTQLQKVSAVTIYFSQTCDYNEMNGISAYSRARNNNLPFFPETPKKRRTQKLQNGLASCEKSSISDTRRELERLSAMESKQAPLAQTDGKTRKRSKVPIQCSNLASFADMKSDQLPADPQNPLLDNGRQANRIIHEPQACLESLAADILAKVRRKKRTKKAQIQDLSISLESCNNSNCLGAAMPYMQNNDLHFLDAIVHKMRCLNISRDHEENKVQEQSAIVPYVGHGMMVPFEGQFDPRKKSRPRAKVVLDQETNRVWNLLMGKENYDGTEGKDIDKEKWWEEERRVFRGRADSFIARMHLVQGDRRFSPWKGSVLDSVIGVFLTQNVSDHLSSSAFMALAARFPCQSRGKCKETNCNEGITFIGQSAVCTIDLNMADKGSNEHSCDDVHVIAHEAEKMVEKKIQPTVSGIEDDIFPYSNTVDAPLREVTSLTEADYRRPLDDICSSQNSVVSSQNSSDDLVLTAELFGSISTLRSEAVDLLPATICNLDSRTSFLELLEIAGTTSFQGFSSHIGGRNSEMESLNKPYTSILKHGRPLGEEKPSISSVILTEQKSLDNRVCISAENATEKSALASQSVSSGDLPAFMVNLSAQSLSGSSTNAGYSKHLYDDYMLAKVTSEAPADNNFHDDSGLQERSAEILRKEGDSDFFVQNIENGCKASETPPPIDRQVHSGPEYLRNTLDVAECFDKEGKRNYVSEKAAKENSKREVCSSIKDPVGEASSAHRTKREKSEKKSFDWESLRQQTCQHGAKKERNNDTMDSLDWDAVRNADVHEIANTIRERGMNNMLAERIKSFLDRLVKDHGSIDLEWLRDIPPDKVKDYLLSVRGLGLKSVECVRLLTLHHLAFPVDTNVGRICVRLGWVPLQPLPESLQLHLLELYPMLETIQKYLWPRLCTLDQRTLYELHYQMITFGKVFCTKSKPNCNACPMRGECKHFASAFASARLALPGPEEKNLITTTAEQNHKTVLNPWPLPQLEGNFCMQEVCAGGNCEPIIEEPATPEPECTQIPDIPDIEDAFCEDPDEIPTIELNAKEFAQNLQIYMQENNMELQNVDWTKALVTLTPQAASIPTPKLKNVSRLRTEHQVYELPDSHPLLEGVRHSGPKRAPRPLSLPSSNMDTRQVKLPNQQNHPNHAPMPKVKAASVTRALVSHIPCRTAMRGSFPLNGTYFQVNEVFADHDSSLTPIDVPRALIWNLPRRTVYFGTSVPTIFRGLAIEDIQNCFWRGFVCVRGFDRKTRGPRPLMARLHFPASKAPKGKKTARTDGE